jgi:hypothetical protein
MAKELQVYGWTGHRRDAGPRLQTREIVAARSRAAAARAAGYASPRQMFALMDTGNDEECAQALSEPGVVFWHPLDEIERDRKWHRGT